jgi:hypothetical protein
MWERRGDAPIFGFDARDSTRRDAKFFAHK